MILQRAQVLGDDAFGGRALEPEMPELQQQALLQIACGDPDRIEALHHARTCSTCSTGHGPIAASSSSEATR